MNLFVKELPVDTQILIAVGSAVAGGCQPCLKQLVALARDEALDDTKIRAAVTIGQFIKDKPGQEMKKLAQSLLGGDPVGEASQVQCGCNAAQTTEACG